MTESGRRIAGVLLNRRTLRWLAVLPLLLLLSLTGFVGAHQAAVSRRGFADALEYVGLLLIPSLVSAGLLIPVALVLTVYKRTRSQSLVLLALCVAYVTGGIAGERVGWRIRMAGFRSLAQRSEPLVGAVRAWHKDHGTPPRNLCDLVPEYIREVPGTQIGAYPGYEYCMGKAARDVYRGNPWVLRVNTPCGGREDVFLYFPKQNYPKYLWYPDPDRSGWTRGGSAEHVADWIYVVQED